MAKLKEILKDAAIGAFIPGSMAYNFAKGDVEWDKADEIKRGERTNPKSNIGDIIHGGFSATCVGVFDLGIYAMYSNSLAAATGIDVGMVSKFAENPSYVGAALMGLVIAGARAGLNIFYKEDYKEKHEMVIKNLEEKGLPALSLNYQ